MDETMTLAVDAHVSGDAITHARYAAQRVKDAVVDTLREATGVRPSVDIDAPDLRLNQVVRKGRAIVSVDLGGGPMHRRSEEHTSELQSLMRISSAVFCLQKKKHQHTTYTE